MMQTNAYIIALLGLIFLGCEEKYPVYSAFCDENSTRFPACLHYSIPDETSKGNIEKAFGLKDDKACHYHVELIKYHVGNCNNPAVKSLGSDFNGYVRIEIKKYFKCYYKAQSDYKSNENRALERVLKKIENEKNLQDKSN